MGMEKFLSPKYKRKKGVRPRITLKPTLSTGSRSSFLGKMAILSRKPGIAINNIIAIVTIDIATKSMYKTWIPSK